MRVLKITSFLHFHGSLLKINGDDVSSIPMAGSAAGGAAGAGAVVLLVVVVVVVLLVGVLVLVVVVVNIVSLKN